VLKGVDADKLVAVLETAGRRGALELMAFELRRRGKAQVADKFSLAAQRLADVASRQQKGQSNDD